MNVEIICVGTELLMGNTLNTNTHYLAGRCVALGLRMLYQGVVGDNPERLKKTFLESFERSDVVILTGGLGPTKDDLTKEIVSEALGLELVMHEESRKAIYDRFLKIGRDISTLTANNLKQAMVPVGCTVLKNPNGTAPGVLIEKDGKVVILLPGPPKELIPMFENSCVPYFKAKQEYVLSSIMLKMIGIGESRAAAVLDDLIETSKNPTIAPYAKDSEVHFRVTAKAATEEEAAGIIRPVADEIYNRLGEYIYTENEYENLEDVIVKMLKERSLTLAVAESCTGGLLAGRIVNVPGASDVLKAGYVTYSNEAKIASVGVSPVTLETFSAVSAETAAEMAEGAAKACGADIGISTTGYAGSYVGIPGTETGNDEETGLVYIGLYYNGKTITTKNHFGNERQSIRNRAVMNALDLIRKNVQ